jgi:hypothetical protein
MTGKKKGVVNEERLAWEFGDINNKYEGSEKWYFEKEKGDRATFLPQIKDYNVLPSINDCVIYDRMRKRCVKITTTAPSAYHTSNNSCSFQRAAAPLAMLGIQKKSFPERSNEPAFFEVHHF